jgi:peptidyl-prolyl cis-trans isomerase SurA
MNQMKAGALLAIFILTSFNQILCQGHDPDKKIVMTIAGRNVEAGEFTRMYQKSRDPGDKSTPDSYIDQFVNFKLKVAEAISKGYDTTKAFRDELNGYRKQLAQSYLTDQKIKDELLRRAYERSLTEVSASHILVSCRPDAKPEDTINAFGKAMKIRQRLLSGEPFEKVAKETSDDKSAAVNGGYLGYFTVFQMIPPFEDAAYTLQPGSFSMPVRTTFGYHIIKVNAKRPSNGKIRVAHIMKAVPPGSGDAAVLRARNSIDSIYALLKNGASFRELAIRYSDHKQSSARGGELDWFGAGEIIPDFSEAAFTLKDTGEYTAPVRTPYGYHIIKLLGRKPSPSFEESRPYLESKISQSGLASLGKKSFLDRIKREYKFRINQPVHDWFVSNTDSLLMAGKSGYKPGSIPQGEIYSFADQHLSAAGFAEMIEKKAVNLRGSGPERFIDSGIDLFSSDQLTNYEDSNLEKKYPDFRYLMNEFHDGILLFDISSEKIWNRVQEDSVGLHNFYLAHKNDIPAANAGEKASDTTSAVYAKEDMISRYQDWLTAEWVKQLRQEYPVKVNRKVLAEIKKRLKNE